MKMYVTYLNIKFGCLIQFQIETTAMENAQGETFLITGGCGYFGFRYVSFNPISLQRSIFISVCCLTVLLPQEGVVSPVICVRSALSCTRMVEILKIEMHGAMEILYYIFKMSSCETPA